VGVLASKLIFEPPTWHALLWAVAAAAVAWELLALVRWARRGRSAEAAVALTAAGLTGGFVTAALAGVRAALGGAGPRDRALVRAGLWGVLIQSAAALAFAAPLAAEGLPARAGPLLAVLLLAGAWAVRSYRRTTSPLRRRTKAFFLALRVLGLLVLAAWLLRPVLEDVRAERVRRWVLIGVDVSGSMRQRDMPALWTAPGLPPGSQPVRRIEAVQRALEDVRPRLEALAEEANVEVFTFYQRPTGRVVLTAEDPGRPYPLLAPQGQATALGQAVAEAYDARARAGAEVAAMALLSDGCNNTTPAARFEPETVARIKGATGVPIHTVAVGSQTVTPSTRRLDVRALRSADKVNAFRKLPIQARVEALGLAGRRIRITCRFGDKPVGAPLIHDVQDARQTFEVERVHQPVRPGYHRLRVEAQVIGPPPEGLAGERHAEKLVRVVDEDLRILYVEGRIRYEGKFVAAALAADRRIRVERRVLLAPLEADQPPPLGESLDDWLRFHAIVFGDVPAEQFSPKQLQIVKRLVDEYGKGFCMFGGRDSFAGGGWAGTPVATILPVDMARSAGSIDGPIHVVPTAEGLEHSLLQIAEADVAAAWGRLRALPGCNRLVPKAGAAPLARSRDGDPLILAQRYGKGRTVAIAFDTTWRWVLAPQDTAELQKRFWRQLALYLANPRGNVWITTDQSRYEIRPDEREATIGIEAGVEDASGRPLLDVPVTVRLKRPGGAEEAVALQGEREKRVRIGQVTMPDEPGTYELTLAAEVEGETLRAEHKFELIRRDRESLDVLANFDLLRRMAAASGGEFHELRDLPAVLRRLEEQAGPKIVRRPVRTHLAGTWSWPVLLALVGLLCIEWAVRKRKGLV